MRSEWRTLTIADVAARGERAIAIGPFGSRMKADCYESSGVPVIRGTNISDTRALTGDFVYISEATADRLKACNVFPGDLVFPHRGAIGEVAIVPDAGVQRYMLSTSLMKLTCNRNVVEPMFLFYFFRSVRGRQELLARASTVGTPGIGQPLSSLRGISVPVPPLAEQHEIARILGALDDKIDLNRRMSETLEAMARALFRSWFVDFDPVRAKAEGREPGVPADLLDSIPDELIESDLGLTPLGWRVGVLGDVAENLRRTVQPEQVAADTPYIALEHMPKRCIALSEWETAEGVESGKFAFQQGEILFGKLRPYFHKVGVAPLDGICSTDILVLAPRSHVWFGFVLGHATSSRLVEYTNAGSTGTRMPRTSWKEMARYPVVLPPQPLAAALTEMVRPLIDRIRVAIHESRALASIRDTLLPKLISGELRVKDAERLAAAVS